MDYLALQLSIRDREALVAVLCEHQPDLLTPTIRLMVPAYEPIIRALHDATNLSEGLADLQSFMTDLIKLSKIDKKADRRNLPNVVDFYDLLNKHAPSSHKFVHQTLQNSNELYEMYHRYAKEATKQYKKDVKVDTTGSAAGALTDRLQNAFSTLQSEDKIQVASELDGHAAYLSDLVAQQTEKIDNVVKGVETRVFENGMGPGIYLAKWQELMDNTVITSEKPQGSPRLASEELPMEATVTQTSSSAKPPSLQNSETLKLLSAVFKDIIAES